MKLKIALMAGVLLAGISVSAQEPQPTVELRKQNISIRMENAPLIDVLDHIEEVSGITITYADDLPDPLPSQPMNLVFTNAQVKDVLKFVLNLSKLTFTVIDPKTIRVENPAP